MEVHEGIQRALDGDALLFVGAGFSLGAISLKGIPFRSAKHLRDYFAKRADVPVKLSLEDAAEAFAEKFGEDSFINEIQLEFTAKEVQDYHRHIACIPWKRVYTTNYDNVLERAYNEQGRKLLPITMSDDIFNTPKRQTLCVHLNGFVDRLDRETIWTELKLTETSYLTASIVESPWAVMFRQDIRLARAVFFIGYSISDLDIKRVLAASPQGQQKTFFIVGLGPDITTSRRCSRFGHVLTIPIEQFAAEVLRIKQTYSPRENRPLSTLSIAESFAIEGTKQITDRDFMNLLLLGQRDDDLIYRSMSSEIRYFLERSRNTEVFDLIDKGERVIVVCSDIGNGKSLFIDGLRLRALEKGFRVFEVREYSEEVSSELDSIAKLKEPVLITIEEYQNWLDEIRLFTTNASDDAVMILTARNAVNDVVVDDLLVAAGLDAVPEIQLDILRDQDIKWFVEALDEYGLWGELAAKSKTRKADYIREKCKSQIHAVLLHLLDSPDIASRLRNISKELMNDKELYRVIQSVFILTLINFRPKIDTLIDIWGAERINSTRLRKSRSVKEFVDFNSYEILVRSPIAAEFMLRRISNASTVVSVLLTMAERIDKAAKYSEQYRILFKNLMMFSNVQHLLPEKGKKAAVVKYYESIKNLYGCKRNPLFWLQYAIASLVIEDLFRAKKYFDTSYSLAEQRGWDTFQIDNHFARYLLAQAVAVLTPKEGMENFRLARTIINRQIKDDRRHYPFRVATSYQDFIDRFGTALKQAEVDEVGHAAQIVLDRIFQLPEKRSHHYDVRRCRDSMEYVIHRAKNYAKISKSEKGEAQEDSDG